MKYRKPVEAINHLRPLSSWPSYSMGEVLHFLDSLPDEFEIVGPGEVAVKWPEEWTESKLRELVGPPGYDSHDNPRWRWQEAILALAAIAPDRKNPTKRRISVLQFQGHGETYGKLELSFNMAPQFPWVKVGECEIEE